MRASHAYLSAALSPLVVRTTGSGDCNRESATSFDLSRHPFFSGWRVYVSSCRFVAVWWFVRLAPVIVTVNSPHYLICLGVLSLSRWHVCCSSMWFDLKLLLFFPSLSSSNCVLAMQKIISTLQFIFFF